MSFIIFLHKIGERNIAFKPYLSKNRVQTQIPKCNQVKKSVNINFNKIIHYWILRTNEGSPPPSIAGDTACSQWQRLRPLSYQGSPLSIVGERQYAVSGSALDHLVIRVALLVLLVRDSMQLIAMP